jgi:hypothetical protein
MSAKSLEIRAGPITGALLRYRIAEGKETIGDQRLEAHLPKWPELDTLGHTAISSGAFGV